MPNLKKYQDKILSEDDKTLFGEAVVAASKGAPRGAYILIWISGAESLKRKFKEAALRDGRAGQILGEIQQGEDQHKSVDLLILKRAKEYGFIDDTAFQKLEHVYDLRCLYGHPYESAPSDLELLSAAEVVVGNVLSKPTTLKHGFVDKVVEQLFDDTNFLEHSKPAVTSFASDLTDKIDTDVYRYLVEKYAPKIEQAFADPTLSVVVRRGIWFLRAFLSSVGISFYTSTQWHDFCSRYPQTTQAIFLSDITLFQQLGGLAKNYIINYSLSQSALRPTLLEKLQNLIESNLLSQPQLRRFNESTIYSVAAAGLKVPIAFPVIIEALKSHNWYSQNSAATLIDTNDRAQIGELTPADRELLGRNILQAAQGDSGSSIELLSKYAEDPSGLPVELIKGIVFECFINEQNQFRLKDAHALEALRLLASHPELVAELSAAIAVSTPKSFIESADYDALVTAISEYDEFSVLAETLATNKSRLRTLE